MDDLDNLKTKLDAADHQADALNPSGPGAPHSNPNGEGMGDAMRLAIDLVACVFVGGALGYFLDRWLGTKPWFLIVFLIFGLVAGFRNFYTFAGNLLRPNK